MYKYQASTDNTGSYLCDYCEKQIPTKKDALQEWSSFEVSGMFCSKKCATEASYDLNYKPICSRELV